MTDAHTAFHTASLCLLTFPFKLQVSLHLLTAFLAPAGTVAVAKGFPAVNLAAQQDDISGTSRPEIEAKKRLGSGVKGEECQVYDERGVLP